MEDQHIGEHNKAQQVRQARDNGDITDNNISICGVCVKVVGFFITSAGFNTPYLWYAVSIAVF